MFLLVGTVYAQAQPKPDGFERVSAKPAPTGAALGDKPTAAPGETYTYQGNKIPLSQAQWYYHSNEFIRPTEAGVTVPAGAVQVRQSTVDYATSRGIQSVQTTDGKLVFTINPKPSTSPGVFEDVRTTQTVIVTVEGGVTTTRMTDTVSRCTSDCQNPENWKPAPDQTTSWATSSKQVTIAGKTRTQTTSITRYYYNSEGKVTGSIITSYDEKTGKPVRVTAQDSQGGDITTVDKIKGLQEVQQTAAWKDLTPKQRDQLERQLAAQSVNTGVLTGLDAAKALTIGQNIGRIYRGYTTFQGLTQVSALIWPDRQERIQKLRQEVQEKFCLAAGIQNCLVSTICGSISDFDADNILVGRGPGGELVSSAVLNAERSVPIEVAGLTRQQLIDLFGNATVIAGRRVNITDPKFDPKSLGQLKIRLYHVQYGITNNLNGGLKYNLYFNIGAQNTNSSYGTPVIARNWFPEDKVLSPGEEASDNKYKFSATVYDGVCLTFSPPLPSGHAAIASTADKLCVPFTEYQGGATTYETQQAADAAAEQAAQQEGGNI